MIIEELPLILKTNDSLKLYYDKGTCNVSVKYCLYERKKKRIIRLGESRPNGYGLSKISTLKEMPDVVISDLADVDKLSFGMVAQPHQSLLSLNSVLGKPAGGSRTICNTQC